MRAASGLTKAFETPGLAAPLAGRVQVRVEKGDSDFQEDVSEDFPCLNFHRNRTRPASGAAKLGAATDFANLKVGLPDEFIAFAADDLTSARRAAPRTSRKSYLILAILYAFIVGLYLCSTASAKPTQQDVFRSIEDNVGQSHESDGKIILYIGGGALLMVILFAVSRRQQSQATPKALNHPGKLLKEIRQSIKLKNSELKQLRLIGDQTSLKSEESLTSPLTLLLCPTVLARAVQDRNAKIDRKLVTNIIRRIVRS